MVYIFSLNIFLILIVGIFLLMLNGLWLGWFKGLGFRRRFGRVGNLLLAETFHL
jgi:hypothetical protein